MNLDALDIPDDPAQVPAWLEHHVMGLDLGQLVTDLTAFHEPRPGPRPSLDEVLGNRKASVLRQGLQALPRETIRQFLLQPRLLLDLQEVVLRDGGPHWTASTPDPEHASRIQEGDERLGAILANEGSVPVLSYRPQSRWYHRPWAASLATAASLLVAFAAYEHYRPRPVDRPPPGVASTTWGWNKPEALPQQPDRSAYLNRLADEAGEWFNQRPTDAPGLVRRINEFRAGCSRLIFAEHQPLPAPDRQWLIENCRVWGRKLDKQLAALEAGQDVLEVRRETDALIHQLMDELHTQARKSA
jgi:hypothetical protein